MKRLIYMITFMSLVIFSFSINFAISQENNKEKFNYIDHVTYATIENEENFNTNSLMISLNKTIDVHHIEIINTEGNVSFYRDEFYFENDLFIRIDQAPLLNDQDFVVILYDIYENEYIFFHKEVVFTNPKDQTRSVSYDGEWSGSTNQGYNVSFVVSDNKVTSFQIKYKVSGSYCSSTTTKTFYSSKSISNGGFTFSGRDYNSSSYSYDDYSFKGTFSSSLQCSGTWSAENSYCGASASGSWNATKPQPKPDISISPSSSFNSMLPVGFSDSKTITVTNTGSQNLFVNNITISGLDVSEFSILNDQCSGQTIAPSEFATFDIAFCPQSVGNKSATLNISSNDLETPILTISLFGTALDESDGMVGLPSFDAAYYLENNPDLQEVVGKDYSAALTHWLNNGISEGRVASPAFNVAYYLENNSDLQEVFGKDYSAALSHWVNCGISEGRLASPAFNAAYYLENNSDLQEVFGTDYLAALSHWLSCGISEGRSASPAFNVAYYLENNSDLQEVFGTDYLAALSHWLSCGIAEGRSASSAFNVVYYLENNSDLQEIFGTDYLAALSHWLNCGIAEGRVASPY